MTPSSLLRMVLSQATILRRNTSFWLSSILMAVISMAVFGWVFNPSAQEAFEMSIVDEDRSQSSSALVQAFDGLDNVELSKGDRDRELDALEEGDRSAVVIVPAGFDDGLGRGQASVLAYYDNSDPVRIGYVTNTVSSIVRGYSDKVSGGSEAVTLDQQAVSTKSISYIDFLTPGMVGMTIMWVNLGVGFLLVTWREQGILRRLGVTPLTPGALILTQASSFALISLTQTAIILTMGTLVFNVEITGSYLWLALTVALGLAAFLSIGYLIGSLLRSVTSVNAAVNAIAFPMIFLGRSYFPIDPPPTIAPIVAAIPLTHLNDALREVVNGGGDLNQLWISWTILAGWAIAGLLVSVRLFRWQ
jgi:ABC-2 type transport system permease protein